MGRGTAAQRSSRDFLRYADKGEDIRPPQMRAARLGALLPAGLAPVEGLGVSILSPEAFFVVLECLEVTGEGMQLPMCERQPVTEYQGTGRGQKPPKASRCTQKYPTQLPPLRAQTQKSTFV